MSKPLPKLDIIPASEWMPEEKRPLIIAGPCSAESEAQVLATAREVAQLSLNGYFRAGIWKPRTRPNSFEGVGIQGLQWLRKVQQETGLKTAVEVANATHVYEALKHGVDLLWIGARTTANPFSVQEIADALRGVDVPVLVKNPINPDLQLWIGALERINDAGIRRLGAIHRGFSTYEKTPFRNAPKWNIAIELKSMLPDMPMICDPSHIGGKPEFILPLSQRAIDMDMHGMMIETHVDPDNALSDAAQQVKPAELGKIVAALKPRRSSGDLGSPELLLADLRLEIDGADNALLEAMSRRAELVSQIGALKRDHNMTILQVDRWKYLLEDRLQKGRDLGLDDEFIEAIYQVLHDNSIRIQASIMNRPIKKPAEVKNGKALQGSKNGTA